ncbi:MAG: hypothetical protein C0621_09075 [Desulfuromonas sp.]|nr:MAG: hypothetical protein C0621_09075 [Desulfuromonas sp.]
MKKARTVTRGDEQLLQQIHRRNRVVLGLLLLLSLPLQNQGVTLGVAAGGAVAIGAFYWMGRTLRQTLRETDGGAARRYQMRYVLRLVALAAVLFVLVAVVRVDPIGLTVGLSVVIISILWSIIQRSF